MTSPVPPPPWRWPAPGGSGAAVLAERLGGASLLQRADAGAFLTAIAPSPFLSDLVVHDPRLAERILDDGPGPVATEARETLRALPSSTPRAALARALRQTRAVTALAVAMADIGGLWPVNAVTAALSDFADAALGAAVAHLLEAARLAGDWRPRIPGTGFVVLAMGKLGGRELNFSSDIDLVLLHDPEAREKTTGGADGDLTQVFTRLARGLVGLLETRDADGYVFRVDLRLRPDPAATPPCVALPGAIAYYESLAQTWERAAMIRARPAAGDLALGYAFLEAVRPFVWRKTLDFAAVADLAAMKRRIDAHKGASAADPGLSGHDLKLGRGGIREVEFIAQTLQLLWGGRDPKLRLTQTAAALRGLVRAGHLAPRAAAELIVAYRFLRRSEHRLQMVADRQTHALPERPEGVERFAQFMGCRDAEAFLAVLRGHLDRVARHYDDVFAGADVEAVWRPDEAAIRALGFAEPARVLARLAEWHGGELRALRSERARNLLGSLLPELLAALGRQGQPDLAFARLDRFLGRLPAGVSLLSLFERNRALIGRLAAVLGAAAPLADHLATTPSAVEGLLGPVEQTDPAVLLDTRLADARALDEALLVFLQTGREEDFAISLATLEARIDADVAGERRAALADATITRLLPLVMADTERRYGIVPGGGLAIVLLGKAGGREMMAGSDLDVMAIYDHPETVAESIVPTGGSGRPVAVSQWFLRAVHALVGALGTSDAAGPLYAIDMRLRPSGNKGPVAVSLAAFRRYHRPGGEAWTWERMALTRARVVAGPPALCEAVEDAVCEAIAAVGDRETIRRDAAAMRARLPAPGASGALAAAKLRPGGLVDVEFIAQAGLLQMGWSRRDCPARPIGTRQALRALVLPDAERDLLLRADRVWRTVIGMLRLVATPDQGDPEGPALQALLQALALVGVTAVDAAGLHATLDRLANEVRAVFARRVGVAEEVS